MCISPTNCHISANYMDCCLGSLERSPYLMLMERTSSLPRRMRLKTDGRSHWPIWQIQRGRSKMKPHLPNTAKVTLHPRPTQRLGYHCT